MKERKPIPKTKVAAIIPMNTIFIFSSSLRRVHQTNKKPVVNIGHGFAKFLLLRQPGYPYGIRGFPSSDCSEFGFIGILLSICCLLLLKANSMPNKKKW
jgi:hypothetical protein